MKKMKAFKAWAIYKGRDNVFRHTFSTRGDAREAAIVGESVIPVQVVPITKKQVRK